jgi:hypothetical protein
MKMKPSLKSLKRKQKPESTTRITNDTVAEHREKILAGGRRYKYPIQYARHRLVFNAIIITVAAVIVLSLLLWWQLYIVQNTSTYVYRITQVLPLPIASIDGSSVRYSDYLLYQRPSAYYLEKFGDDKNTTKSGNSELNYVKRAALDRAIVITYARKVAQDKNLVVSESDIEKAFNDLRSASNGTLSEEAITTSAERNFGFTKGDIYQQYRNSLTVSKAAFAVDDTARIQKNEVQRVINEKKTTDLSAIAKQFNDKKKDSVIYGMSGLVNLSNISSGIRAADVAKLEKGVISAPIQSITDDGYFFIKLVEKNDTQVSYEFIQVPLHVLNDQVATLKKQNKVHEYISIDTTTQ